MTSGVLNSATPKFNQAKATIDLNRDTQSQIDNDPYPLNGFAAVNVFGFLNSFDEMFLRLQFRPPASFEQYFENIVFNRQKILCSREGVNLYKQALRSENDRLVSPTDAAYNNPAYSGIPLTYCAELDSAAIFPATVAAGANFTIEEYDDEALDPHRS